MNMPEKMELQRKEFNAANAFAKALGQHNRTPIVDDDYPEVRHQYEGALAGLIEAMKANGRFEVGNRYGLPAPPSAGEGDAEQVLILADMIEGGRNDCGYVNVQINAGRYRRELVAALRRLATPTPQSGVDDRIGSLPRYFLHDSAELIQHPEGYAGDGYVRYSDVLAALAAKPTTAGQQAAGVSEEVVTTALDAMVEHNVLRLDSSWEQDCSAMRAALEAVWPTAAGAAPEGSGVALIAAERQRQITAEGWTHQHDDDEHEDGQLARAAACYAMPADRRSLLLWPWSHQWWKPGDRIRELTKAGALIAAEIDRLQRAATQQPGAQEHSA